MNSEKYYRGYLDGGYSVNNMQRTYNNSGDCSKKLSSAAENITEKTKVTGIDNISIKLKQINRYRSNNLTSISSEGQRLKSKYYERYREELRKESEKIKEVVND